MKKFSEGMSCEDCGNQAKKNCRHVRCRSCCKRRGFNCQTHLKSTWIPAANQHRRRQQLQGGDERHEDHHHHHNSSPTGLGEVNFPAVLSLPAEFKCVRINSVDDDSEGKEYEYAYSTEVNIGGHMFRGILYDYGPDHHPDGNNYVPTNASNNSSTTVEGGFNLISPNP